MDKKIAIDLIKLDVLNLSTKQDFEALNYLKRKDEDFPWKELGEYQNLIAVLAATTVVDSPPYQLKNEIISRAKVLKKHLFEIPGNVPVESVHDIAGIDIFNKSESKPVLSALSEIIPDNFHIEKEKVKVEAVHHSVSSESSDNNIQIKIKSKEAVPGKTELSVVANKDVKIVRDKTLQKTQVIPETKQQLSKSDAAVKEYITFKDPDLLNLQTLLKNRPTINLPENDNQKIKKHNKIKSEEKESKIPDIKKSVEKSNGKSINISEKQLAERSAKEETETFLTTHEHGLDKTLRTRKSIPGSKRSLVIAGIIIILTLPVFLILSNSSSEQVVPENIITANVELPTNETDNLSPITEGSVEVEDLEQFGTTEEISKKEVKETDQLPPLPSPPKPIETTEVNPDTDPILTSQQEPMKESETKEEQFIPPVEIKQITEEVPYFVAVEEMPEPIGGIAAIQKRVVYPKIASLSGVEGKVIINAYVNETGNVTKAEVVKGIGAGCDEAAIDAVINTKFKPGMQRGKPVNVKITIPIIFKKL